MIIEAIVSPEWTGSVSMDYEVFGALSEALYLRPCEGGEIFLVYDRQFGILPFGAGIEQAADFRKSVPMQIGDKVRLEQNELFFYNRNVQLIFKRQIISNKVTAMPTVFELEQALSCGIELLKSHHKGLGRYALLTKLLPSDTGEKHFVKLVRVGCEQLKSALEKCDLNEVEETLKTLLGLGIGLTPSMDDFLTGLVYLFQCVKRNWGIILPEIKLLEKSLCKLAPVFAGTFSVPYVTAAANGRVLSLLEETVINGPFLLCDMERLLRVGGSSGSDMLAGLLFGLRYILQNNRRINQ